MLLRTYPLILAVAAVIGLSDVRGEEKESPAVTKAKAKKDVAEKELIVAEAKDALENAKKTADDAKAKLLKATKGDLTTAKAKTTFADLWQAVDKANEEVVKKQSALNTATEALAKLPAHAPKVPAGGDKKVVAGAVAGDNKTRLLDKLYTAAQNGSVYYRLGHHEFAASIYERALFEVFDKLDTIEQKTAALTGLQRRVNRALTALDDPVQRSVYLRTAINDIRNVPKRGDPKTLFDRMGGESVVWMLMQEAMGTSTATTMFGNCSTSTLGLNPLQSFPGFEPGAMQFMVGSGVGLPFHFPTGRLGQIGAFHPYAGLGQFGGLSPYTYQLGMNAGLRKALREYCVPEPEIIEFLAYLSGVPTMGKKQDEKPADEKPVEEKKKKKKD
jgi:hypothetical protein